MTYCMFLKYFGVSQHISMCRAPYLCVHVYSCISLWTESQFIFQISILWHPKKRTVRYSLPGCVALLCSMWMRSRLGLHSEVHDCIAVVGIILYECSIHHEHRNYCWQGVHDYVRTYGAMDQCFSHFAWPPMTYLWPMKISSQRIFKDDTWWPYTIYQLSKEYAEIGLFFGLIFERTQHPVLTWLEWTARDVRGVNVYGGLLMGEKEVGHWVGDVEKCELWVIECSLRILKQWF